MERFNYEIIICHYNDIGHWTFLPKLLAARGYTK